MKALSLNLTATALIAAVLLAVGLGQRLPADEDGNGDDTTKRRTFGNGVLSENIAVYDVDDSGGLSVEEYQTLQADRARQGRHNALRSRWDVNRDGQVDARERTLATQRIRQLIVERRTRRFNEVDRNSDGFLSKEEFLGINAVTAADLDNPGVSEDLFKHLDHNGDQRISQDEFLRSLNTVRPTNPDGPDADPKPRDNTAPSDALTPPVSPGRG